MRKITFTKALVFCFLFFILIEFFFRLHFFNKIWIANNDILVVEPSVWQIKTFNSKHSALIYYLRKNKQFDNLSVFEKTHFFDGIHLTQTGSKDLAGTIYSQLNLSNRGVWIFGGSTSDTSTWSRIVKQQLSGSPDSVKIFAKSAINSTHSINILRNQLTREGAKPKYVIWTDKFNEMTNTFVDTNYQKIFFNLFIFFPMLDLTLLQNLLSYNIATSFINSNIYEFRANRICPDTAISSSSKYMNNFYHLEKLSKQHHFKFKVVWLPYSKRILRFSENNHTLNMLLYCQGYLRWLTQFENIIKKQLNHKDILLDLSDIYQ